MITKDQLLHAMTHECDVAKHLFTKFDAAGLDYRPSPEQRNTIELLRYLSVCGIASVKCLAAGDWSFYKEYSERAAKMTPADFPAAMDRQKAELTEWFGSVSDEAMRSQEAVLPTEDKMPLGAAIMNAPLKWLTGYKLQLFLYAKACGATDINTANAWMGVDYKK